LRCAVWFSTYGLSNNQLELPYESQSPVLRKKVKYETKEDVIDEIQRVINESIERGYDIGQSLYFQMPFFCNPSFIISDWCWQMIADYFSIKKFNIPLANNLDSVDAWTLDCFNIIDDEVEKIKKFEVGKNGS
tara:strand:- start:6825 stop:7223 length:399 start_codon:yes stop_codon:yes gene_type:complete